MKITSVTATAKATINTGDYSNITLECTISADLEEGDTLAGVQGYLFSRCRSVIAEEVANQIAFATVANDSDAIAKTLPPMAQDVKRKWAWLVSNAPYLIQERFSTTPNNDDEPTSTKDIAF